MNTLLGGSFTSRLNDNLREQHGYAYGASSGFDTCLSAGLFQAGAGVQTDKTSDVLASSSRSSTDRRRLPRDDVERARTTWRSATQRLRDDGPARPAPMVDAVVYGLPDGFYEGFVPKALAVDASRAAAGGRDGR